MNAKAKELGLTDYKFVNATGLENKDLHGRDLRGQVQMKKVKFLLRTWRFLRITWLLTTLRFWRLPVSLKQSSEKALMMKWTCRTGTSCWKGSSVSIKSDCRRTENRLYWLCGFMLHRNSWTQRNACYYCCIKRKRQPTYRPFRWNEKMFDYAFDNFSMKEIYAEGDQVKAIKRFQLIRVKRKK